MTGKFPPIPPGTIPALDAMRAKFEGEIEAARFAYTVVRGDDRTGKPPVHWDDLTVSQQFAEADALMKSAPHLFGLNISRSSAIPDSDP